MKFWRDLERREALRRVVKCGLRAAIALAVSFDIREVRIVGKKLQKLSQSLEGKDMRNQNGHIME
jgi:hypothetical protein